MRRAVHAGIRSAARAGPPAAATPRPARHPTARRERRRPSERRGRVAPPRPLWEGLPAVPGQDRAGPRRSSIEAAKHCPAQHIGLSRPDRLRRHRPHDRLRLGVGSQPEAHGRITQERCAAQPPSGVHPVSQHHRGRRAGRDGASDPRQLRRPQAPEGHDLAQLHRALVAAALGGGISAHSSSVRSLG